MPDGNMPLAGGSGPTWNEGYAYAHHMAQQTAPSPAQVKADARRAPIRAQRRQRNSRQYRLVVLVMLFGLAAIATGQLIGQRNWGAATVGAVFLVLIAARAFRVRARPRPRRN